MIFYPNSDYVSEMQLILAIDFKDGMVVHGSRGDRAGYRPLTWGAAPSAVPGEFVRSIRPRFIYIADLDRIEQSGDNTVAVSACAPLVSVCYVDRGCRSPGDLLAMDRVVNIIGTETAGDDLGRYTRGYLSIDLRNGQVIPSGAEPVAFLKKARHMAFEGCIILNISSVGTECGLAEQPLEKMRDAYDRPLLYGGGVATMHDLKRLQEAGFDGAVVATGLHRGTIPLDLIRRGSLC
jgi:phosphoribosylformimino-5-aminoimidazole carboxamide ribotide isomerase